jgi:hypothetical protein
MVGHSKNPGFEKVANVRGQLHMPKQHAFGAPEAMWCHAG